VPDAADAEAVYRLALDRSAELGARMTQLRAATRLARLRLEAGDAAAAAALLSPVYASFTEGLDTADLREARGLLEATGAVSTDLGMPPGR
jgi:adenylate cyclase